MEFNITTEKLPDTTELLELFSQTKWANNRSVEDVRALLKNTNTYVVIRDEEKLIGFGRAITDGIYRALLDDIVIDKNYRNKGLGGQIIDKLMDRLKNIEEVFLNTGEHLEKFYQKFGFKKATCLTMTVKIKCNT